MPNRINRVVTKTGDEGVTSMADGGRYPKDHPRVELVGALDEANCAIGVLATCDIADVHQNNLIEIQSRLFDAGAAVALGRATTVDWQKLADELETELELLNAYLEPLEEFLLPGGGRASAQAHVIRATIRRAERQFWTADLPKLDDTGLGAYINRLSDYFFVLARTLAQEAGEAERLWKPGS